MVAVSVSMYERAGAELLKRERRRTTIDRRSCRYARMHWAKHLFNETIAKQSVYVVIIDIV